MTRLLFRLVLLCIAAIAVLAGAVAWYARQPLIWQGEAVEYALLPGTGLRQAAHQIEIAGVPVNGWLLGWIGRFVVDGRRLQAGSYVFASGVTPVGVLEKMTRGDVSMREVRFIEGWTWRQMRAALAAHPDLKQDAAGLADAEVMARIGAEPTIPEGWFFPDTYLFASGDSDLSILKRAHHAMRKELDRAWAARSPDLPYASSYEALVLASIIEKETGSAADRDKVASVFVNRLRAGMPLQTDPSVIYGLGERFDGNLTRAHLQTDGPYNSYLRRGLPPTPIAAAGRASLEAALNPAVTRYYYFVARGDGSSAFSQTLAEHNSAVDRYQRRSVRSSRK